MVHPLLTIYNLALGLVTGIALCYLLYLQVFVFEYRRSINVLVGGLLLFMVGSPVAEMFLPGYVHVVHGSAALLTAVGLYGSVYKDLEREQWVDLLLRNPKRLRRRGDWMTPMDMDVLDLMNDCGLVLSPAIIAHNLEYSREAVNRRLGELAERGFVERVDHGKYRITALGSQFLDLAPSGEIDTRNEGEPIDG